MEATPELDGEEEQVAEEGDQALVPETQEALGKEEKNAQPGGGKKEEMMTKTQLTNWLLGKGKLMATVCEVAGFAMKMVQKKEEKYTSIAGAMRREEKKMQGCLDELDGCLLPQTQLNLWGRFMEGGLKRGEEKELVKEMMEDEVSHKVWGKVIRRSRQ